MKKIFSIIIALLVLATARTAFADCTTYTGSGFGDTSYNGEYDIGGTSSGHNYYIYNGNRYLYVDPNNPDGAWLLDSSNGNSLTQAYYIVDPDPTVNSWVAYFGSPPAGVFSCGSGGGGGAPTGVAGLIESASTTFANDLGGISLVNVEDQLKSQMLLVAGSALGFTRIILPYILVVAIIFGIVYFIYRGFIFFRH